MAVIGYYLLVRKIVKAEPCTDSEVKHSRTLRKNNGPFQGHQHFSKRISLVVTFKFLMIALCPCYIYISFSVFIYAYRAKKRGGYRTSHEEIIFIYIVYDQVFYDEDVFNLRIRTRFCLDVSKRRRHPWL
jgi:hypothetical protein